MGISVEQLRDYVIAPTCKALNLYSPEVVDLILGTGAQESQFQYIHQKGTGPALGLFQCEPNTYNDIVKNELNPNTKLKQKVLALLSMDFMPSADALVWNIRLSVIMCRLHYERCPGAIPKDLAGQAAYYKKYYNTIFGAATEQEYIDNFYRFVRSKNAIAI